MAKECVIDFVDAWPLIKPFFREQTNRQFQRVERNPAPAAERALAAGRAGAGYARGHRRTATLQCVGRRAARDRFRYAAAVRVVVAELRGLCRLQFHSAAEPAETAARATRAPARLQDSNQIARLFHCPQFASDHGNGGVLVSVHKSLRRKMVRPLAGKYRGESARATARRPGYAEP